MLLTLLLVQVALAAAAPPLEPINVIPLTKSGGILSVSPISILSFPSKPYASSSVRVPPASQRLLSLPKASVTVGTSMLTRASPSPPVSTSPSEQNIPQGSTLLRQFTLTRGSSSVDPVPHVETPHIASLPKPLSEKNRKPPPVARLSNGLLPKNPSLFRYDSSDLDYQQQVKRVRDLKRMSTQNSNFRQKDKILLKELKEVLQENNEDYLESRRPDAILSGRRSLYHRKRHHPKKRRRHHDRESLKSGEDEYWSGATTSRSPEPGAERSPHRRSPSWGVSTTRVLTVSSIPPKLPEAIQNRADTRQVTINPQEEIFPERNLHRFMAFVKKNRELLKAFIAQKKAKRMVAGMAGGRGPGGPYRVGRTRSDAFLRGLMGEVLHATRVPSPFQLDIAPGRGARIEKLRLKGRICQRNVMKPEGPKYNSHGKSYMPEFVNKPLRNYGVTKKKHFILPNCCNCCQKSVLGCE